MEDYCDALEEHFGDRKKIPAKLESVVKKGEKEINERIKVLKMADRVSWAAVDKYQADPLCDGARVVSRSCNASSVHSVQLISRQIVHIG